MPNYNKVILAGNLTRDPELRYTPAGVAIAKISLAINRSWRTETGELREEVTFVDVEAFRKQAEAIGQYLKKGRPILVEGRLKLDQWEDKQSGQKRSRLAVVLENFQFLDSGTRSSDESGTQGAVPRPRAVAQAPAASAPVPSPVGNEPDMPQQEDDDVPF